MAGVKFKIEQWVQAITDRHCVEQSMLGEPEVGETPRGEMGKTWTRSRCGMECDEGTRRLSQARKGS